MFTNYATQSGGRTINYTNFVGNGNTMGPMTAFTICGWINCASPDMGSGGNRIAYCLNGQNYGFDLVLATNGFDANAFLKLGVNEWPDNTPAISSSSITIDPTKSATNWVFFAVTYDGSLTSQNISFYFGNGSQAASLNWTTDYNKGPIQQSGILGIGNANQNIWFAGGQGTMGDARDRVCACRRAGGYHVLAGIAVGVMFAICTLLLLIYKLNKCMTIQMADELNELRQKAAA